MDVLELTNNDLHQLCTDTGCKLKELPGAIDDRDRWQGRVREQTLFFEINF